MHYWNLEKDAYIVIANDGTIVREHPILTTK
jgi:UDP-N-acetylglucosamine 2-epimerase